MNTKLRKGDLVQVISGKERGKQGKILEVDREGGRVLVEGVNLIKRTIRKSKDHPNGGFVTKEAALSISKVMFYDDQAKRPVRLGYRMEDGKKVRFSKKTGQPVG